MQRWSPVPEIYEPNRNAALISHTHTHTHPSYYVEYRYESLAWVVL